MRRIVLFCLAVILLVTTGGCANKPGDRRSRIEMLTNMGMEEGYALLSEFDKAFYAGEEDLNALHYAYVQNNKDAFS